MTDKRWSEIKHYIQNNGVDAVDAADYELMDIVNRHGRKNKKDDTFRHYDYARTAYALKYYYDKGYLDRSWSHLHYNGFAAVRLTRRYVYELTLKGEQTE